MDWLTFVSKIFEFSAWPMASIVLVLMLRSEIKVLLPFIKKLKAGPLEAEFEKEVKVLRFEAEAQLPLQSVPTDISPEKQMLFKLVQINPRSAVLEAWQGVEASAGRVVSQRGLYVSEREAGSPLAVIRVLSKNSILSSEEVALFHDLRSLRNQVAHSHEFNPTTDAALNYIELASRLRSALERSATNG